VPPVVHVLDFGRVEKDAQRLSGETFVVGEDFIVQGGDPAASVAGLLRLVVLAPPESRFIGATPTSFAICSRFRCPSSGK
jgi:hypothetical protein